jgi:thiosulfate dehydrogenase [quinone] large subunit
MLVAFFESLKHVGHLFPVAFLRIYIGYFYLLQVLEKYHGDFLVQPRISRMVGEWLPRSEVPEWYRLALERLVVTPHWQPVAYFIVTVEFIIGVSYILGYAVRPVALVAILLTFNLVLITPSPLLELNKILLALHLVMGWIGAGRCLGFDYFFFKRRRGLWW